MATVPPGGIVPVPEPGGGVGAPTTVAYIINAKWANAQNWFTNAIAAINAAAAEAEDAPQLTGPVLDTSYLPPEKPDLPLTDPEEGRAIYDEAYAQIGNLIEQGFKDFLSQNFPTGPFWDKALAWLERAIDGGTGVDAEVERQIWERDKARFLAQSAQAEAEAMATWANRGFPLPPGALVGAVQGIRLDASRQLAGQSRDIAINAFRAELENTRFAVQQVLELRLRAISAAGEYIRTLVLGPQTAMQLATGLVGLKTDLARSLTAMYQAEVAALEPKVRLAITDAQLKLDASRSNLDAELKTLTERVNAALAHAKMVADAAAASLNGIGAGASISGSDSSSL